MDLQLRNAFAEGNWALVARLADRRTKGSDDPSYYQVCWPLAWTTDCFPASLGGYGTTIVWLTYRKETGTHIDQRLGSQVMRNFATGDSPREVRRPCSRRRAGQVGHGHQGSRHPRAL